MPGLTKEDVDRLFAEATRLHSAASSTLAASSQSASERDCLELERPQPACSRDASGDCKEQQQLLTRAEELYQQVLQADPRHANAMHQLGALLTQAYGKERVNKLQYRTPEALRDQLLVSYEVMRTADAEDGAAASTSGRGPCGGGGPSPRWRRCVDLGCGTGLMGPLLLPYCASMEGVDLSSGMLEQAGKRGIYSRLAVGELVTFLEQEAAKAAAMGGGADGAGSGGPLPYDLLVAADVFVYIGNLQPVLAAAAAAAAPGAVIAFSTEALELAAASGLGLQTDGAVEGSGSSEGVADGGGVCSGLRLQVTGRYAHTEEYLRRTGEGCGWGLVAISQSVIRRNGGEEIWGHLCVMRKA
ncbi:hypothetical protein TSOC_005424 [Tetrabaena socialis]|uniref:Methyltransferase type 12 domain-containing protein n=1 Tax=Tetrabaena socialis TaxID=47790 RepID=A0A2J8A6F9_9CHLO|nr:hypothetical protein TSOC_005424 [Tetrabaena socialis]|eukprot:PNH08073.1 hypothetical protein TSOC_005424 [Tetrabaena socialis]